MQQPTPELKPEELQQPMILCGHVGKVAQSLAVITCDCSLIVCAKVYSCVLEWLQPRTLKRARLSLVPVTDDVICLISRNVPLFSTINCTNSQGLEREVANKHEKSLNILIMKKYKEFILDNPSLIFISN